MSAAPDTNPDDTLDAPETHDAWQGRLGAGQRTVGFKRSTEWFVDERACKWRLHGDLPQ
jgi:hypothetical protein